MGLKIIRYVSSDGLGTWACYCSCVMLLLFLWLLDFNCNVCDPSVNDMSITDAQCEKICIYTERPDASMTSLKIGFVLCPQDNSDRESRASVDAWCKYTLNKDLTILRRNIYQVDIYRLVTELYISLDLYFVKHYSFSNATSPTFGALAQAADSPSFGDIAQHPGGGGGGGAGAFGSPSFGSAGGGGGGFGGFGAQGGGFGAAAGGGGGFGAQQQQQGGGAFGGNYQRIFSD